jgi:hypothetical protein
VCLQWQVCTITYRFPTGWHGVLETSFLGWPGTVIL